ncbi:MAG: lasso RiPP family leader peptide-containing protein [Acidimicrobiia bacterium]|nr:lasso RiPP family leader peptide-containing protein [Acidimicrobiia bacterium]MBT8216340.1 lasso RiPP family leader peptide-containing protein [Acidimicrobiia bacterium]NNF08998.1 lasso RiPP family leader peptide-containing protein [Acidimicrobiia bacterium]NNL71547.1 lasso RiPP family leader peptide-containing protein [Acidimicrobiia bacterium]
MGYEAPQVELMGEVAEITLDDGSVFDADPTN